ncbi:hypothetical protein TYRP_023032, partial [Tyrophagus putrescentiae]
MINRKNKNKIINNSQPSKKKLYKMKIVWKNVMIMIILHGLALYGFAQLGRNQLKTVCFEFLLLFSQLWACKLSSLGAHRLWSHKSYKANFGVRLFLCFCQTLALQNDIYEWCRDHRAHHKFVDTDADPHNSSRGFFFSHVFGQRLTLTTLGHCERPPTRAPLAPLARPELVDVHSSQLKNGSPWRFYLRTANIIQILG